MQPARDPPAPLTTTPGSSTNANLNSSPNTNMNVSVHTGGMGTSRGQMAKSPSPAIPNAANPVTSAVGANLNLKGLGTGAGAPTLFGNSVAALTLGTGVSGVLDTATRRRFKDILIFEERLRWNKSTQQANRRLWIGAFKQLWARGVFASRATAKLTTFASVGILTMLVATAIITGYFLFATPAPLPQGSSFHQVPSPDTTFQLQQHQQPPSAAEFDPLLFSGSSNSSQSASHTLLLYTFFLSTSLIIAFFALGFYRSKLRDPKRMRPMVNKVLKHYCLEMHERTGEMTFSRKIPVSFSVGCIRFSSHVT
ncbi:hypothetical protein BC830DRAFT_162611 [Chytriomyces sp. MP71]|nr:hypothetical protein BC830DRAFT_162611 [Chytriomyces sp. MP71]